MVLMTCVLTASGVYGILCSHYHPEDMDFPEQSEPILHYITYNAGTRVLNTYPEVRVLYDPVPLCISRRMVWVRMGRG